MRKVLYIVLLTVNLSLAFVLLLSYLSTYISPAKIWILAFTGLIYPYVLAVNIFFIFFWAVKLKKEALISLAVVLMGWNHLMDYSPFKLGINEKRVQNNEVYKDLRILSYNVRAFNIYDWMADSEMPGSIINLIQSEKPDVLCIQEYYTGDPPAHDQEHIRKAFKDTPYSHIHYVYSTGRNSGYGMATYTRYPIVGKGVIKFPNTSNITTFTDVAIEMDTFRIYNNHLQSLHFHQSNYDFMDSLRFRYNEQQLNQLKEITRKIKNAFIKRSAQVDTVSRHIMHSPYPVIICGDFNDTPVSYTYRKMRAGLKDSFVSAGGGFGNTYLGVFPSFRIDYIFHSPGFVTIDFERIKAEFSDHYPIICRLRYFP